MVPEKMKLNFCSILQTKIHPSVLYETLLIIICIHWKHDWHYVLSSDIYYKKQNTKYFYYINTFLFTLRPYLFHLCWTGMTHPALGLHGAI